MSKKVLVLCTGNSCRSIIAEALINHTFNGQIEAHSSGVSSSGRVNPKAKKILEENEMWKSSYHSKDIDSIIHIPFDLVITVCDNASQTCPIFPRNIPVKHIGFDDPDGQGYESFKLCFDRIKENLLPFVQTYLLSNSAPN